MKTTENEASVDRFISGVADAKRRDECRVMLALMREVTGMEPKMWGSALIGFGRYHYHYATGRQGDMPLAAFSPRKKELTVYVMSGTNSQGELLKRLGRHKTGGACLYLPSLDAIDMSVMKEIVKRSVALTAAMWANSATQKGPTLTAEQLKVATKENQARVKSEKRKAAVRAKSAKKSAARAGAAKRVSRSKPATGAARKAARRTG
jgi:hypothetical protein